MQRGHDGFTLIEAVVAAGLLVCVALGTTQLFALAIAQNLVARQQLVMGIVAAAKIDELAATTASGTVAASPADALDRTVAGCSDTVVESGRTYIRRWLIAEVPGYGADAYAITVRVLPSAPGGSGVRLATIRAAAVP